MSKEYKIGDKVVGLENEVVDEFNILKGVTYTIVEMTSYDFGLKGNLEYTQYCTKETLDKFFTKVEDKPESKYTKEQVLEDIRSRELIVEAFDKKSWKSVTDILENNDFNPDPMDYDVRYSFVSYNSNKDIIDQKLYRDAEVITTKDFLELFETEEHKEEFEIKVGDKFKGEELGVC